MNEKANLQVLYRWPSAAKFGRVVPKTKFYEHSSMRAALRGKFVEDVQRVTWAYKLAESTLRLEGSEEVREIQVFTIETKGGDVSEDVLTAIDKAVHFPIIFEIANGAELRMTAALKTLAGNKPKVSSYFTTGWLPFDFDRVPLPAAVNLSGLYDGLITSLLPVATRRSESMSEATARIDRAKKLEREIAALERKLRSEPQLNRKFELRRDLLKRQAALLAEK